MNSVLIFKHYWYGGGGALPEKWGYGYVRLWRPPYHALLAVCKIPISAFFCSQDPTFTPKSQFFRNFKLQSLKISKQFSSKASNWDKFQFTRLHFVKKFSSQGFPIWKWSIHKPLCSALLATHLYQNERLVPPSWYHIACNRLTKKPT